MLELKYLDYNLTLDLMKIPTMPMREDRIRDFIIEFACKRKNVEYYVDEIGNIYLTKGEADYYPCLTAHMDSAQEHDFYLKNNLDLPLLIKEHENKTYLFCSDNVGLGCDDKCGIAISLSILDNVEALKCAFFVCEEIGCKGSLRLDKTFFKDVGYVIGFDSPLLNRAAHTCMYTQLFSSSFHENYLKEICEKWGVKNFYREPFTDVMMIKKNVMVQCMNFGSGYYQMHTPDEFCIIEEMENACGMGIDLINELGNKRYEFNHKTMLNEEKIKENKYLTNLSIL